ncbi:hypothetical protein GCM10022230_10510 [Pseudoclavibacter caeni]
MLSVPESPGSLGAVITIDPTGPGDAARPVRSSVMTAMPTSSPPGAHDGDRQATATPLNT